VSNLESDNGADKQAQIARDIFDSFERLIELGEKINFCLERFSVYIDIFDLKGVLRDRLVLFYQEIILFCLEAANAYERGKTSKSQRERGRAYADGMRI